MKKSVFKVYVFFIIQIMLFNHIMISDSQSHQSTSTGSIVVTESLQRLSFIKLHWTLHDKLKLDVRSDQTKL